MLYRVHELRRARTTPFSGLKSTIVNVCLCLLEMTFKLLRSSATIRRSSSLAKIMKDKI